MSKVFEKLFLKKLKPLIENGNLIPNYQFGFRQKHSTIDQVHRITDVIECVLEEKQICSAVFLEVAQAFDRVWHEGLIYKLNKMLPDKYVKILTSYISDIKQEDVYSELKAINAGVPQGSVLGPILYLLYTYDIPKLEGTTVATFADDTALLTVDTDQEVAVGRLQDASKIILN